MGLFSSLSSALETVVGAVTGGVSQIIGATGGAIGAAAPAITAAAPILQAAIAARTGGLVGSPAGGAGAVVGSQIQRAPLQCPFQPGVMGNAPGSSPIANAALRMPFNQFALPARPVFGQQQIINTQLQGFLPQAPQTTSFNQGSFGQPVGPTFRPFAPSFRSGQSGFSGPFTPGISQGLAPGFGGVFNAFGGFN